METMNVMVLILLLKKSRKLKKMSLPKDIFILSNS